LFLASFWSPTVRHVLPPIVRLDEIAKAHAWFIAIHPFGDGNGRVSRALVMAQCLNARLMPPIFDGENRAMYCAAMEHAMVHGRYAPLVRLFHEPCRVDKELYRLPTV
jgi:hypothetical protein